MFFVVGLGNPGGEYAVTRHNIGFIFLDYLAEKYGLGFKGSKWQADMAQGVIWQQTLVLAKPQTYMNLSGAAVGQIARFYRIAAKNIIVVHDDIDLPFGRIRVVTGRGAGGHNGVRSVIEHLGSKDFSRIRAGVGRPAAEDSAARHVLGRFSSEERERFPALLEGIEHAARLIVTEGVQAAMNQVNAER